MERSETTPRKSRVHVPVKQMYGVFQIFRGGHYEQIGDLYIEQAQAMWAHSHLAMSTLGMADRPLYVCAPVDVPLN